MWKGRSCCFPVGVFSCPVMQHEQHVEKLQWLHKSQKKHNLTFSLPGRLVSFDQGERASGWNLLPNWKLNKERKKLANVWVNGYDGALTVARTTAGFRATAASHVAAAGVRTALTPTYARQDKEQDTTQDYNSHKHPLWNKEHSVETIKKRLKSWIYYIQSETTYGLLTSNGMTWLIYNHNTRPSCHNFTFHRYAIYTNIDFPWLFKGRSRVETYWQPKNRKINTQQL